MSSYGNNHCVLYFDEDVTHKTNEEIYTINVGTIVNYLRNYYNHVYMIDDTQANDKSKNYSMLIYFGKNEKRFREQRDQNLCVHYLHKQYKLDQKKITESQLNDLANECITFFRQFYSNVRINNRQTVAVFDFDDTLVNEQTQPFYKSLWKDLKLYRDHFDYVILWTHGSENYMADFLRKEEKNINNIFNLIITRKATEHEGKNKGLGAILRKLNINFGVKSISFAILVDNLDTNFINDYDLFWHVDPNKIINNYYCNNLKKVLERKAIVIKKGYLDNNKKILKTN